MKIKLFCLSAFLLVANVVVSQELRTTKSGEWADVGIWERKSGNNWISATDIPRSASNVTIQSSHIVTLTQEAGPNCSNLTLEKGATLKAVGAPTLRIGTGKNSTEFKLINNGTIESGSNAQEGLIRLDIFNTGQKIILTGDGKTSLGRFQIRGANPNKVEVFIDTDLTLTEKTLTPNFTAMDVIEDRRTSNDDVILTINKGKTVTLNQSTFHSPTAAVEKGGKYTYNILGTLDMSGNTNANHFVAAMSNPESAVVLNVGGTLILGSAFNTVSKSGKSEGVSLNILDGGIVDATKTKKLILGSNQFKMEGSGVLKR